MTHEKSVLILGANSDVAKELLKLYAERSYRVIAASRNTDSIRQYLSNHQIDIANVLVTYFDATDFRSHRPFYDSLPFKPAIVVYAAGFLSANEVALQNFEQSFEMMKVHYCGAVSIINIVATDHSNGNLRRIIGLSSLSGVRGRKSNFIYGSTKAAFTQYLAGLRQYLFPRQVVVNVVVAGYIRSKMTDGLDLPESLMLEPSFIARSIFEAGSGFTIVPGLKWKVIYNVLKMLPERLVAKLP